MINKNENPSSPDAIANDDAALNDRRSSALVGGLISGEAGIRAEAGEARRGRLPPWLKRPLGGGERYARTAGAVSANRLHTICEEARCPNRGECWSHGTATFMILGALCTRRCGFCSVEGGRPGGELDRGEPERLAAAIHAMDLDYAVITSVDRDDLPDRGAAHFAECIRAIRALRPATGIELLTPDFRRKQAEAIEILAPEAPFVWGHNVETVPRLYPTMRPGSAYADSLALLRCAGALPGIVTKSSIMLGVGETLDEVLAVLDDLRAAGVARLTIGQYLQPTPKQLPVQDYLRPEVFGRLAEEAWARGFRWIVSSPFARSSYRAELPGSGEADAHNLADATSISARALAPDGKAA